METIKRLESNVRSYSRSYPTLFRYARGALLEDDQQREYIDFLAGSGVLNYGHNNAFIKDPMLKYLMENRIIHGLDMATTTKQKFLATFEAVILVPRGLNYIFQFTGPTGTNAVEAAFKIARRVTGRHTIVSFSNGFHGVSLGALAATANEYYRGAAGLPLSGTAFLPYDGFLGPDIDTIKILEQAFSDPGSGLGHPAAVIVETVQAEGGMNPARFEWLRAVERLCRVHGAVLIVDDIQMGCGRTGPFFSFEPVGISPDIVLLSKSLSGYGLPLSLVLLKPELDCWKPAEHNGTFRGNNLALKTATTVLNVYWRDDELQKDVARKGALLSRRLETMSRDRPTRWVVRGRGLAQAIDFASGALAKQIRKAAFDRGLIVETCGSRDQAIKCIPPLTISEDMLQRGLDILEESIDACVPSRTVEPVIELATAS
jgi:diaminobutyrate-2-oxoglutarate transaminase